MNALLRAELSKRNITYEDINSEYPMIFTKKLKSTIKLCKSLHYRIYDIQYDECENDYIIVVCK